MKSKLYTEELIMPGADLGPENPLPNLRGRADAHAEVMFDGSVPQEERRYFNYGKVKCMLPYLMQDGYNRRKKLRPFRTCVLENRYLKAVFMPDFGGRLWSLQDKESGRQLLHVNPVFQPANLALRNAWVSGGVEWNIGMTGHTPFTVSPLFTASLSLADGTPVLRMYEWERIRRVSFQIDAALPEDSRFLYVRIRLHNTQDCETPIYWWSNIAVDETPGTRVLAPANTAFAFDYNRVIRKTPVPVSDGMDKSYTTRSTHSQDLFFDIPPGRRKWEAALDERGEGLVQASTEFLQGRKLFMWGVSPGGNRWQRFLAEPGRQYMEIQAGLAKTQMEHLPMPAKATWQWVEAYGMMRADPGLVHSGDWDSAVDHVEERLENALPRQAVDDMMARLDAELDHYVLPECMGSGWAALELARLGCGERFDGEAAVFPSKSLGPEQAPWIMLLEQGRLPEPPTQEEPVSYMIQPEWLPLLERAVENDAHNWYAWMHLGVMYYAAERLDDAGQAFRVSLNCAPNAWSMRTLAMLSAGKGDFEAACAHMLEAVKLKPNRPLAVECANLLLQAGRYDIFEDFHDGLPEAVRQNGRLKVLRGKSAVMRNDLELARRILEDGTEVDDLREGEVLTSDLWIMLHTRQLSLAEGIPEDDGLRRRVLQEHPVPAEIDFRMRS